MDINFETSLPLQCIPTQDLKDYRKVARYMHRKGILDKVNKLEWLSKTLPHFENSIEVYQKYAHITPEPKSRNAICVVSTAATMSWCMIAQWVLRDYDVFFICDKPFGIKEHLVMLNNRDNVHFVHMHDEPVKEMGYIGISAIDAPRLPKQRRLLKLCNDCGAWEKSLFYFSYLNFHYDNIWFMEDDCLILKQDQLIDFDRSKNKDVNYVRFGKEPSMDEVSDFWAIKATLGIVQNTLPNPEDRSASFAFTTRLSSKMFDLIYNFCTQHNRGLYLELFFASLIKKYGLKQYSLNCLPHQKWEWIDDSGNSRILVGGSPLWQVRNWMIDQTDQLAIYHHAKGEERRIHFLKQYLYPRMGIGSNALNDFIQRRKDKFYNIKSKIK